MEASLEANLFPDAATPSMSVSVVSVSPYNTYCSVVLHCLVMLLHVTVVPGNARLDERNPTNLPLRTSSLVYFSSNIFFPVLSI